MLEIGLGVSRDADVRRMCAGVSCVKGLDGSRRLLTSSRGFLSFRPVWGQKREQFSEKKNGPFMTLSIFLILSSSSSCNSFRRLSSPKRSFSLFATHWIISSIDLKLSSTSFLISASLLAKASECCSISYCFHNPLFALCHYPFPPVCKSELQSPLLDE